MNAYEFVQALRRQKWLLIIGFALLILVVFGMLFKLEDGQLTQRITPKYSAEAQFAVVPSGVTSLTDPNFVSRDLSGVASIYGELLSSPEATVGISEETGVDIIDMRVVSDSRSPIIRVFVDADTPEGASKAALGAFRWLSERFDIAAQRSSAPTTTTLPSVTTTIPPKKVSTEVVLVVEPSYLEADPGLWLAIDTFEGDGFATQLPRLVSGTTFPSVIYPGDRITFLLGPEIGDPDSSGTVRVPELPADYDAGYTLELRLRRGLIVFPESSPPELDLSRVRVEWRRTSIIPPQPQPVEPVKASLLLLTEMPSAQLQGALRAPILVLGILITGTLVLLVLATARDTFQRTKDDAHRSDDESSDVLAVDGGVNSPEIEAAPDSY
ncbi:MAG TPA: hypothetical protein ENH00_01280 [Actinobacteria bacterium]|nr:hypothetical protein BMS3Bbin01_00280 [bacterium BMS3Bbin01]HDH24811.1 hypothetical protein [Actinomycetota bacterium]